MKKYEIRLVIYWKMGFDNEPGYNHKYIKAKINLYNNKINTNW